MDGWTTTWMAAGALALGVLLVILLTVALVRSRAQTQEALESARAAQDELARRLANLEAPAPVSAAPETVAEFVITEVGGSPTGGSGDRVPAAPSRLEGRLFVDIVLRESVVKAASWTHGVRHALSAENRNRLRFEMRRETKRATKRRKADIKEALRLYYADQADERSGTTEEDVA